MTVPLIAADIPASGPFSRRTTTLTTEENLIRRRQAQVKTRRTDVVEMAVKAKRLIVYIDAPNSGWEGLARARLCTSFDDRMLPAKIRFRDGKMTIEDVISSLFRVHKNWARRRSEIQYLHYEDVANS